MLRHIGVPYSADGRNQTGTFPRHLHQAAGAIGFPDLPVLHFSKVDHLAYQKERLVGGRASESTSNRRASSAVRVIADDSDVEIISNLQALRAAQGYRIENAVYGFRRLIHFALTGLTR